VDSVIKINRTNSADQIDFSNFYSLYFFVENVLMLTNLFKKEKKSGKVSRGGKLGAFTVPY
jgi:hypothetical protein